MNIITIYLLVLLVLLIFLPSLSKKITKIVITIILSVALTYLTLFEFNQNPIFLNEEISALNLFEPVLKNNIKLDPIISREKIILVDIAGHSKLIRHPQPLFNDSTATIPITDRVKLTALFEWLAYDSIQKQIDLVVCDILFDYSTPDDKNLHKVLRTLTDSDKLFLTKSSIPSSNTNNKISLVDSLTLYSVSIIKHENLYFSHNLLEEDGTPSLPYAMYLHRQNLVPPFESRSKFFSEHDKGLSNKEHLVINWFIPNLIFTNQDINGKEIKDSNSLFDNSYHSFMDYLFGNSKTNSQIEEVSFLPIGLGAACQKEGQDYLLEQLLYAKKNKQYITIFIGNFSGDFDIHQTAFGSIYGGLILLDIYLNLIEKLHQFDWFYMTFLLIGYFLIIWVLLIKKMPKIDENLEQESKKRFLLSLPLFDKLSSYWIGLGKKYSFFKSKYFNYLEAFFKKLIKSSFSIFNYLIQEIIIVQLHYWLLLMLLFSSVFFFRHIVNIMGLVIFLGAVDFGLKIIEKMRSNNI